MTRSKKPQKNAGFRKSYLYCVLFTLVIIGILIFKLQLYPLGDHYFRYMDADQYYGFYGYLTDTFFSNNDLKYSWSMILGNGMLSTFAYYASSPFNLLLVLFKNNLILGTVVITFLKLLFISCSFCTLLNSCDTSHEMEKGIISAGYAFVGYVVFYAWNASWLDGVGFLPLMILGLKHLLDDGKKCLYVIVLGLTVLSNFYIGFMLCITSAVFYLIWCLDPGSNCIFSFKRLRKSFFPYACSSVLGVGLSMGLLLPTYFALPESRKTSLMELWKDLHLNFSLHDFLSMFYTGSVRLKDCPDNLPVVFIGIIQFLLVIVFFLNKRIRFKEKAAAGILILIMAFSFQVSLINVAWHGLSINAWFNYRYSFVLSFILLLIAYRSITMFPEGWMTLLLSELLFLLMSFVVFYIFRADRPDFNIANLAGDIFLSVSGLLLIWLSKRKGNKYGSVFQLVLCVLVVLNMAYNGTWVIGNGVNWTILNTSAKEYFSQKEKLDKLKKYYDDSAVTRIGNCNAWGRCEPSQFAYAGAENFASTENLDKLETLQELGFVHRWYYEKYSEQAPRSTDDLLGFKYIISNKKITNKSFELIEKDDQTYYYENTDALPLFFLTGRLIGQAESYENAFEYQNELYHSFLTADPIDSDVFEKVEYETETENHSHHVEIEIRDEADQTVYLQIPKRDMTIKVDNGSGEKTIPYTSGQKIYCLGKTGTDGRISVVMDAEHRIKKKETFVYRQREDVVSAYIAGMKALQELEVVKETSSHLRFETDYREDAIYTSSVPYDPAWDVYIDGTKTVTNKNAGCFLSFTVEKGKHLVELYYHPKGLKAGIFISLFSLLLLIASEYAACRMRRSKMRRS